MNSALLVIDVQLGGLDGVKYPPMHNGFDVVEAVNNTIRAIRHRSIPVIFIQHSGGPGSEFEKGATLLHFSELKTTTLI